MFNGTILGVDEGTGITSGVPDVRTYESDAEQISWKSSDEEDDDEASMHDDNDDNDDDDNNDDNDDDTENQDDDNQDDDDQEHDVQKDEEQDDVNKQTDSDNDGDDFAYPKLSTHDEEDKEEEDSDPRVHTPSNYESINDEESDEEIQGANVEGEEMDEEETNEEDEVNELYRDVNVNLEGRDTEMTYAPRTIVQTTQVIEDTHMFWFDHRLKTLETNFSELKQTNKFAVAVSSILGIVDAYLANKMQEAIKTAVQLQFDRLKDEAQAENADFINKLDDNIKKIINDQVKEQVKAQVSKILPKIEKTVNEQLEAEVLTHASNESKASYAVAANLSELEMKNILIDKMESNKSIHISDEQKNLYKALVNAYESDKLILDTYGETVSFKRRRDEEDKDEEPSTGSNWGSKRRRAGKEPDSTSAPKEKTSKTTGKSTEGSKSHQKSADGSAQAEEPMQTAKVLEEPAHHEFKTVVTEDQPDEETSHLPDWFQKPAKPPTQDYDWNKTLPNSHGPIQPWLSSLAQMEDLRELFNELMDTPLDFSAFMMNRLKVDTITPELLAGPTFELMKGSCKSLVELEYFFEEVYKATTDQLDWNNPEGQQYPYDLQKPLPLIPNSRGRRVIPFDHFINNDLAYLSGGVSSQTYTTSVTKTKAADYGHIKWIEDLVLNTMESARDVYSKRKIIVVTKLQIVEWHNYKHLDWITVRRDDDKLYKFKEGDFNRLRIQDIEDMLLLLVQGKLTNLTVEERLAFNVSLRMFTRSIVIQRRVEDLQLGVESYQKKLNLTKPDTYRSDLKRREAYTAYSNPRGFIYQNKDKKNRLMRIDELHKFSDGTLNDVRTALDDRSKREFWMVSAYEAAEMWRQNDRKDRSSRGISDHTKRNACDAANVSPSQIVLWIVDNGCSKHMTGNLKLLRDFVKKFMDIVRFGNDNFTTITGYGDYVLRIENGAKTMIFGLDSIKFAYYLKSRRSRKNPRACHWKEHGKSSLMGINLVLGNVWKQENASFFSSWHATWHELIGGKGYLFAGILDLKEALNLSENMTQHHFQWDAEVYHDTTTDMSAHYSKTTFASSEQVEVLGNDTGYTIKSVQHQPGPGHPNTFHYSYSDESDEDEPSEVLQVHKSINPLSGSHTPSPNPVVESLSPSLTPCEDSDLLLEETDAFLSLDDSKPPGIDNGIYDSEGDILFLEGLLNDEILSDLPHLELNNDPEGDILFLENLLKDEPLEENKA
ncbi:hypothetical protein Tco_0608445 [Tanacetum coccineum]